MMRRLIYILIGLIAFLSIAPAFAQQQPVNIGAGPNDHTGDPLRTAFIKLNANDAELYANVIPTITAGGTNTYTATPDPTLATLVHGKKVIVTFTNHNTGASTFNPNGLGAVAIKKYVSGALVALASGDISDGQVFFLVYDGTNSCWQINVGGGGAAPSSGSGTTVVGTAVNLGGGQTNNVSINRGGYNFLITDGGLSFPAFFNITTNTLTLSSGQLASSGQGAQASVTNTTATVSSYDYPHTGSYSTHSGIHNFNSTNLSTSKATNIQFDEGGMQFANNAVNGGFTIGPFDYSTFKGAKYDVLYDYNLAIDKSIMPRDYNDKYLFGFPLDVPPYSGGFGDIPMYNGSTWSFGYYYNIAGLPTSSTVVGPGAPEHGKVIAWDNTNSQWDLVTAGGGGGSLTVGTSAISGGTSGRVLYNNAGVLGEYTITGTGNAVLGTNPTLGGATITDATNIVLGTTTGTKIGTATSQKLGFFNATPVVQQGATTDLGTVMSNLGLRASGTAYPITTSGAVNFTGGLTVATTGMTVTDVNLALGTTTGTKFGTATTQKLSFFNSTPIVQPGATTDLGTVMSNLGLRASGTAYPITTSGAVNFTGGLTLATTGATITDVNIALGTTTGTKIGTATSQKLGFFNATPIVQPSGNLITGLSNLGLIASGSLSSSDIPTLNQNTTGSAATLTTGRTIGITGDITYTSPAFDGSGNVTAAATIGNDKILESHLKAVNTPTDEYFLTYESTTGDFEWQVGGGAGETNTGSNLGGGLANYSTKVGVDLRFNSFDANNFDLASNLISLDYANSQSASGSLKGFLTSADWTTFNNSIDGSGTSTYIPYFNGTSSITGEAAFNYNSTTNTQTVDNLISSANSSLWITSLSGSTNFTNTALTLRTDISSTPLALTGTGLDFETETASSVFKVGSKIESIATDVTTSSEDFDLVFKQMTAGAAAAETFRIKSTGDFYVAGSSGTSGQVLTSNGAGAAPTWQTGAGGGVTSVDLSVPSFMSVTGNPVTTTGTLAVTLNTQSANTVFSGPSSGSAAAPTFRSMVAADLAPAMNVSRTLTTAGSIAQTDNLHTIYLNSSSPFNLTVNSLTDESFVSLVNTGTAAVTLLSGTATITGTPIIAAGGTAVVQYEQPTAPLVFVNSNNAIPSTQVITSGSSGTISASTTGVLFNPASLLSTYTLTMPASPTDGFEVTIMYGGTVTVSNTVITALTISPNSGQSILQTVTPSTAKSGDLMKYRYVTSTTTWFRVL